MSSLPLGERLLPLAAVAVLLVLLVLVLIALVRTVGRRATPEASPAAGKAGLSPANEAALGAGPVDDSPDLTMLKAFTPDLLPRLSLDDEPDTSDAPVVSDDSKPNLVIEEDAAGAVDEPSGGSVELIVTSAASQTDRGLKRTRNEDACLVDAKLDLYVVADGMGGYAGGDVAANTAVAEVHKALRGALTQPYTQRGTALTPAEWPPLGKELSAAIERANEIINDVSKKSKQLEGMGTTFLAARFSRREQRVYVAYVGDSRLYRFRAGKLQQLTVDHTLGAKGVVGPLASNIRRAVGVSPSVKVDLLVDKPMPADLYMLCSDGVYKMVKDDEMIGILAGKTTTSRQVGWKEEDLKERVATIVKAANAAGGKDNITVVLVGVGEASAAERAAARPVEKRA